MTHSVTPQAAPPASRGGIGVYEWNPETLALTWDATAAAIFQAHPGETPAETWLRRAHVEDQARVRSTFSTFDQTEALYRLVMDDGSIRHVLARSTHVVTSDDDLPTAVVGVFIDITDSVQTSKRLESMLDSISDGFCTLDHDFRFTYVNPSGEKVLGMPEEALVGRTLWEAFPHTVGSEFEVAYRRVLEDKVAIALEEFYPEPLNMWLEARAQPSDDGLVVYFQDVSERRERQDERERLLATEQRARRDAEHAWEELSYQATHDALTGLATRPVVERFAREELASGPVTALFLDLDSFKLVNDSLGHAAGDALLVEVGRRIREALRSGDLAARIGGDEFVVLLPGADTTAASGVAERLLEAMRRPVRVGSAAVTCTVSVGLASVAAGTTVEHLLRDADIALYRAKDAGRDTQAWFDVASLRQVRERVSLEHDLRVALAEGQIEQPT